MRRIAFLSLIGAVLTCASGITCAKGPPKSSVVPVGNLTSEVTAHPLVFVVRHQHAGDHHNTATLFQTGEINAAKFQGGSALRVIDFAGAREVRTLLSSPHGVIRDLAVHFSGTRLLFSMRRDRSDDYHIYTMRADGSGLQQLTFGSGVSDIDPIFLADDRILFSSTREPKYCMCNRHIMCNLFTMDGDGANMQQIGHSTLFEGHASLLPDGRVLYDRWEYVDRNFGDAQGAWTCNPDGTNHAVFWGNNTNSPGAVLDCRSIPGTRRFVCTFSSCHDRPWGALAIVDPMIGLDGRAPVIRTWPASAIDLVGQGNYDTYKKVRPRYEDPYPITPAQFLCARTTGNGEEMGIYLVTTDGDEVLIHAEAPGCFDPMPLRARPRPPAIAPRVDLTKSTGLVYVSDVYSGMDADCVRRGEVRYLRVVESPEKRFWTQPAWNGGTGQQAPGMAWDDFNNKCILGTVPVAEDGSAYFRMPADRFAYFQLLDAQGMMVQSMRSGTIVRPGETIGCVGCHKGHQESPLAGKTATALLRRPDDLQPWYGPERNFNYVAEVQPVWDRHCVSCHDYGKPAGEKLNLAGDLGPVFNTSYIALRRGKFVNVVGAGPFQPLPPKSWGTHASRLSKYLVDGHGDPEIDAQVHLDAESIRRVFAWIDINAPYYPEYASAYPDNRFGRCPLDDQEMAQLEKLTGSADANFTRPEWSACLQRISDHSSPKYQRALAIIQAGQERLAQIPRADMPGFQLVTDRQKRQQAKYDQLRGAQRKSIEAVLSHKKFYGTDKSLEP